VCCEYIRTIIIILDLTDEGRKKQEGRKNREQYF